MFRYPITASSNDDITVYGNPSSDGIAAGDIATIIWKNRFYLQFNVWLKESATTGSLKKLLVFGGFAENNDIDKEELKKTVSVSFYGFLKDLEKHFAYEASKETGKLVLVKGVEVVAYDQDDAFSVGYGVRDIKYEFPGKKTISGLTIKGVDADTNPGIKRLEYRRPNLFKWDGGSWTEKASAAYDDPNGTRVYLTASDSSKIYCDFRPGDYPLIDAEEIVNIDSDEKLNMVAKDRGNPLISFGDGEKKLLRTKFTRILSGESGGAVTDVVDDEPEIKLANGLHTNGLIIFGFIDRFDSFEVKNILTSGTWGAGTWQYSNGFSSSDWGTLTVTDGTNQWQNNEGRVYFDPPDDWRPVAKMDGSDDDFPMYYVRYKFGSVGPGVAFVTCQKIFLNTTLKSKSGDTVSVSADIKRLLPQKIEDQIIIKHNSSGDTTVGVWDYGKRVYDLILELLERSGYISDNLNIASTKITTNNPQINFWGKPPDISETGLCRAMCYAGDRLWLAIDNRLYYVTDSTDWVYFHEVEEKYDIVYLAYDSSWGKIMGFAIGRPVPEDTKNYTKYHEVMPSQLFYIDNAASGTPALNPDPGTSSYLRSKGTDDSPVDNRFYYRPGGKIYDSGISKYIYNIGRFTGLNWYGENLIIPLKSLFAMRLNYAASTSEDVEMDVSTLWSNRTTITNDFYLPDLMRLGYYLVYVVSATGMGSIRLRASFDNVQPCLYLGRDISYWRGILTMGYDHVTIPTYGSQPTRYLLLWDSGGTVRKLGSFETGRIPPGGGSARYYLTQPDMTAICYGDDTIPEICFSYIFWDELSYDIISGQSAYGYPDGTYGFQIAIIEMMIPNRYEEIGFPSEAIWVYDSSGTSYSDQTSTLNSEAGNVTIANNDEIYIYSDHKFGYFKFKLGDYDSLPSAVTCYVSRGGGSWRQVSPTLETSGTPTDTIFLEHPIYLSCDNNGYYWNRDTNANINATDKYIFRFVFTLSGSDTCEIEYVRPLRRAVWMSYDDHFWKAQSGYGYNDLLPVDMCYNANDDYVYGCFLDRKAMNYHVFTYNCSSGRADTAVLPNLTQSGFNSNRMLKNFTYNSVDNKVYCVECDIQNEEETSRLLSITGSDSPVVTVVSEIKTKEWNSPVNKLAVHQTSGTIAGIASPDSGYLWFYHDEFYIRIARADYGDYNIKNALADLLQIQNMIIYISPSRTIYIKLREATSNYSSSGDHDLTNERVKQIEKSYTYPHTKEGIVVNWSSIEDNTNGSVEKGRVDIDKNILIIDNRFINDIHLANLVAKINFLYFVKKRKVVPLTGIFLPYFDLYDVVKILASNVYHSLDRDKYWDIISIVLSLKELTTQFLLLERS
ncbi:MAG: hypothetical protein GF317_04870 [Candidatus Lokiarchaeota archaeon]|nr:hypothetical protein [Candidatus Lokiarchaeota archaeon]